MSTKKNTTRKPKTKKTPAIPPTPKETVKTVKEETTSENKVDYETPTPFNRPGIAFVIPFVDSTVKWEELRYALRSIAKFGIPEDKVFILAENIPDWISDEVTLVKVDQIKGRRFAKTFDAVEKLKAAIAHPDIPETFIYTYDDTVFLEKIHPKIPAIAVSEIDPLVISGFDGSSIWKEVLSNTIERLRANDLPLYNYETHLPRTFEKEKLVELIAKFGFRKRPYMIPTLYFNNFYEQPDFQLRHNPLIKADIRSELSPEHIVNTIDGKSFLNYNDAGLNQHLKDFLSEMFNEKCRFEK